MLAQWLPYAHHPATPLHVSTGAVAGGVALGLLIAAAGVVQLRQDRRDDPEPAPDVDRSISGSGRRSGPGSFLTGLGGAVVAGSLLWAGLAAWSHDSATGGLDEAGQEVIAQSVQDAQSCVSSPPQPIPGPDGKLVPIPCPTDPRGNYAGSTGSARTIVNSTGVYSTQLAPDYATTGHVQVTGIDSHQQICVTVPADDNDPGSVTPGPCP